MRPIANFTLHAALATALIAFAATGAAAGPAFIKLGTTEGETVRKSTRDEWIKTDGQLMPTAAEKGKWIEIQSFQWGPASGVTQSAGLYGISSLAERSYSDGANAGAAPHRGGGFNEMSMDDTAGKEKKAAPTAISHDLRTNVVARTAPPPGSSPYRANDRLRNAGPKSGAAAGGDPDRPIVTGSVPNASAASPGANETLTVGGGRTETASGQATGKRQHMPIRVRTYYDQPLARGSVWVRVSSPWSACRVGARYPSLELGGGTKRYVLQDVTVASCGGSGDADDRPTEEVAFYYNKIAFNYASSPAKVQVRGWDPKKKEE